MSSLFISHSSNDDVFVRKLRAALADHGEQGWIDSRELRGGQPLWPTIKQAIEDASAFAVVISPAVFQSEWVSDELEHALKQRKKRGHDQYPVLPLMLDGAKLGAFKKHFGEEPLQIRVSSQPGGVEAAMNEILVALGKRLPTDVPTTPQPKAEPLEELVLELTDLKIEEKDNIRRATARARLVYEPATPGQREVASAKSWRLTAPLGPIERDELSWYLEKYAVWPAGIPVVQERAKRVEDNLVIWGQRLHEVAMPVAHTANVLMAWQTIDSHAGRRFSVHVDSTLEEGADPAAMKGACEAATTLLGLPWELLHDGKKHLFQGAEPVRVRRRLPNTQPFSVPVVALPIRILLVTARPEDESCGYIDHRASAIPLVDAMESLPGLVELTVLNPPTFSALSAELDRARTARTPYHVIHFDGHGVYEPTVGLGGLCFEHPDDINKLDKRRHVTVYTNELGPLLSEHRVPLVVLEACQTAQADQASDSVASELLKGGVVSVVAMTHSVLVETARRFVGVFYKALADGKRVGDAMLAGQLELKNDTRRGRIFGADDLKLEDWFVPVLYQEKDDPQLFKSAPSQQTKDDFQTQLTARLGELPKPPATGFVGRSRDLLALQRHLQTQRYAVVRGQGGEGKTALAAEFARWMVRSHQMKRSAFVSVETHSNVNAVLDSLGRQLVGKHYSVATFPNIEKAILPIERALIEQRTLIVIDNMESILLPPYLRDETPEALSEDARIELEAILQLCERLQTKGDTRMLFTSREVLPSPFDAERNLRELRQLSKADAVKLVERTLDTEASGAGASGSSTEEEIEQLVEAVNRHARTLALLAPSLKKLGARTTRESLVDLMAEMEKRFPGSREKSVYASVELSLQRLSPANRERVHALGVFHGGVSLAVLRLMMEWTTEDVGSLAAELIGTGLATPNQFGHLSLNPSLCPYLRGQLDAATRTSLTERWVVKMSVYVELLRQQQFQNIQLATTLTQLELPNLFALLALVERAGDGDATIALTTSLYTLLQDLGKPQLVERVGRVRDAAAQTLVTWNHSRFEAARTKIEQLLTTGQLREACDDAQQLLQRARSAGTQAYPGDDYDLAMACLLLGRVLQMAGDAKQALQLITEAKQRFETFEQQNPNRSTDVVLSASLMDQGDCLRQLGQLDKAMTAYEEAIQRCEQRGDVRSVAVCKAQLGYIRIQQKKYMEALRAYTEAREQFQLLDEPNSVASAWHQTGMCYLRMDQPDAAEEAYRKSLTIEVQLKDDVGQATTLVELGSLYFVVRNRPEEAVGFYRQAADKFVELRDEAGEGRTRNNLAETFRRLRRLDEARQEIRRAIECSLQFGHASQPWASWGILAKIEMDAGNMIEAAKAKQRAFECYLSYRRDGGENHEPSGRFSLVVTQSLRKGEAAKIADELQRLANDPKYSAWHTYFRVLQAIVAGSRDRTLANTPELHYSEAAEIVLLIDALEQPR